MKKASASLSNRSRPPARRARRSLATAALVRSSTTRSGSTPADAHADRRASFARVEPPAVTLVGDGRTAEPVADHVASRRQGRSDHLGHVLGPRRQQQERLGAAVEGRQGGVEQEGAESLARGGAAGLPGQHGSEGGGQARRLGGLASPLAALEDDESSPVGQASDRFLACGAGAWLDPPASVAPPAFVATAALVAAAFLVAAPVSAPP